MIYLRGNALDYERWVRLGAAGWSYAEVLPYFKRSEAWIAGRDAYHGDDGPLRTTRAALRNPLDRAFLAAGVQAGYLRTEDVNGFRHEGFGHYPMTVHRGRRWSTSRAYLAPARRRANLTVMLGAQAERVLFEGRRAGGVALRRGGGSQVVRAAREVPKSAISLRWTALARRCPSRRLKLSEPRKSA